MSQVVLEKVAVERLPASEAERPLSSPSALRRWLPRAWLACGLVVAALLATQSLSDQGRRPIPAAGGAEALAAGEVPSSPASSRKAIADVRVGDRVLGLNPLGRDGRDAGDPEPAGWRLLRLRLSKREGGSVAITLLRPLAWFREQQAKAGGTLWLDLEELDACGEARVLAIEPCPPIAAGPGEVVTGTFAHDAAGGLLEVRLRGQTEPVVCTARHPFWSEDRQAFVAACQLKAGERLRGRAGPARVETVAPRPGAARVFNLEVRGEHVYQVSALGLLVHNNSTGTNPPSGPGGASQPPATPPAGNATAPGSTTAPVKEKFHYTDAPESSFRKDGLWTHSSVTDDATLTPAEAVSKLGVKRPPDKIIVIADKGQFRPNNPPIVQRHPKGPGGGTDFTNEKTVPPEDIIRVIHISPPPPPPP